MSKAKTFFFVLFALLPFCFVSSANDVELPDNYAKNVRLMAAYLKQHFSNDDDRLWCLQRWMSKNITYDYSVRDKQKEFNTPAELAQWTIDNKVGVCANFAQLFAEVAKHLGMNMLLVDGYVQNCDRISYMSDSHQWCACVIDNHPYIYDPTWGSGNMVTTAGVTTYQRKLDSQYFKARPEDMIKTHVPVDPLLQFLDYPLKYEQTVIGDLSQGEKYSNWRDTLSAYLQLDTIDQYQSKLNRILNNGKRNAVIEQEVRVLQDEINTHYFNQNVLLLNEFVVRKNADMEVCRQLQNSFNTTKIWNADMRKQFLFTLDSVYVDCQKIEDDLNKIKPVGKQQKTDIKGLNQNIEKNKKYVKDFMTAVKKRR